MRSFLRSDTARGLLVSALLVCVAAAGAVVIDRHAEQHGHCAPLALIDVERAQRLQRGAGRQVEGRCGGHASFFATGRVSDAVRRGGIESDGVGQ